jgi:hypothetical protein
MVLNSTHSSLPLDQSPERSAETLVVLHQNAGPTLAHFVRAPAEHENFLITELDSAVSPTSSAQAILAAADHVLVVRYLPRPWLRVIQKLSAAGTSLTFLMDDDLLDPQALEGLPSAYQRRLRERITNQARHIPRLFSRIWVTSAYLKAKYCHLKPHLLELCPEAKVVAASCAHRLAYLGTASHPLEFAWLVGLLERLQQARGDCTIEIFGDIQVNRQFRHIPGVRIVHPKTWDSFLRDSSTCQLDVMLCPLLDHPFNRCRAPVKFLDAARMGAVGVYSDRPPYQGFIRQGMDGILLPDDLDCWIAALHQLLDDQTYRATLVTNAKLRADGLCASKAVLPLR